MGEVAAGGPDDAAARKVVAQAPTVEVAPPGPLAQSASTTALVFTPGEPFSQATTVPGLGARPAAPPSRVGEHVILSEIARGGMGVVYRARHERLGREVALKMLTSTLATASEIERFRVEAAASASLDHPGIVPVHEFGEHEGRPWLSLKLITGGSLKDHLPRIARDPRALAGLVARIARAMDHAHQRGVLHRDLKPANVLLDPSTGTAAGDFGSPVVTDFGLAKRAGSGQHLTETGAVVGTPSYMAPEQARGDRSLTTGVDIYALGAILYEGLTGRPPFLGPTPLATVLSVLEKEVVAPRALVARVDRDLETICMKCLERKPERRYPTAGALADDLERRVRGEPIAARPTSAPERVVRWMRRRPALAALLVLTSLGVVAGVAGTLESNRQISEQIRQTILAYEKLADSKTATLAALDGLKAQEKETALALSRSRIALAQAKSLQGDTLGATAVLESCTPALRGFEWNLLDRELRAESGRIEGVATLAFSPDSRHVAVVESETRKIRILDLEHGATLAQFDGVAPGSSAWNLAIGFSPDGSRLAVASGRPRTTRELERLAATPVELALFDAVRGERLWTREIESADAAPEALAFSPDGARVAILAGVSVFEPVLDEPSRQRALAAGSMIESDVDGSHAYSNAQESRTYLVAASDGTLQRILHAAPWDGSLGWSADGRRLLAGALWNTASWDHVRLPELASALALSPEGARVVVGGGSLPTHAFAVLDVATLTTVCTCLGHTRRAQQVAWSADGERLFSASSDSIGVGETKVWDAATGQAIVELGLSAEHVVGSPDGRWLATLGTAHTGGPGTARFMDVATRGKPRFPTAHVAARFRRLFPAQRIPSGLLLDAPDSEDVAWSPDGSRLLATGEVGFGGADHRKRLRLMDPATGDTLLELEAHAPARHWRPCFSPDGRLLAAPVGHEVVLHDAATGARLRAFDAGGPAAGLVFGASGRTLGALVLEGTSCVRRVFRVDDGTVCTPPPGWGFAEDDEPRSVWLPPERLPGLRSISDLASAPRDSHFALAWPDGDGFWVEDRRGVARRRTSVGEAVVGVALDLSGRRVAVETGPVKGAASSPPGSRIRVFDVATGAEQPAPPGLEPFVGRELGPDAQRIELACRDSHLVGNHRNGPLWGAAIGGAARTIAPDGWSFVELGPRPALLELPSRSPLVALDRGPSVACAWRGDGERVVLATGDGVLHFWDCRRADDFFSWQAHSRGSQGLEFSPDGQRLASCSADHTIVVLDGSPRAPPWHVALSRPGDR